MTRRGLVGLGLVVLLHPAIALAQGRAAYADLYRVLEAGQVLAKYPRLAAVQRITSRRAEVRPEQIEVIIEARSGAIRVPIAADGRAEFPLRPDLLAENPSVRSNQPQGTLSVTVSFELKPPAATAVPYVELSAALDEAERALAELGAGGERARVAGIEFRFPPGVEGRMVVVLPDREDLYLSDPQGSVVLKRLPGDGRQALVQFDPLPIQALPLLEP
jgi:hypothetical protein